MRLLFFFIFLTSSVYGQVSEIITETWYLRSIRIDGEFNYLPLGETIELNFTDNSGEIFYETNGIENVMGGNATFDVGNEILDFFNITVTLTECIESNCPFEDLYFYEFLTNENLNPKSFTFNYHIFSNGNKSLRLEDLDGNRALFLNYPLQEPSTELFQTWHLHSIDADLGETTYISDFEPPISPSITINPDFTFSGEGSCNTFSGQFNYTNVIENQIELFATSFQKTNNVCEYHSVFEENYFFYFEEGLVLRCYYESNYFNFEYIVGVTHNFYNYPVLSINDTKGEKIKVFPNPVNDLIRFENPESLKEIIIYSTLGQELFSTSTITQELNISFLNAGIYFVVLETESGKLVHQILKQ